MHLSDKMRPSDETGVLCQNVSVDSMYVSTLMTEREVLIWSYNSDEKYKNKIKSAFGFNYNNFN